MTAIVTTLPSGEFLVNDNTSELGPFSSRETAEAAERMLNAFNNVDSTIQGLKLTMKGGDRDEVNQLL